MGAKPSVSRATEIWRKNDVLYISGLLTEGDSILVGSFFKGKNWETIPRIVDLNSMGGNMNESIEIALIMASHDLAVRVAFGSVCYSACFLLLAMASRRAIDLPMRVGVHRVKAPPGLDGRALNANAENLYRDIGISERIISKMMSTREDDIALLGQDDFAEIQPTQFNNLTRRSIADRYIMRHRLDSEPAEDSLDIYRKRSALLREMPVPGSQEFWRWFDTPPARS
jgi:hypothetical protein